MKSAQLDRLVVDCNQKLASLASCVYLLNAVLDGGRQIIGPMPSCSRLPALLQIGASTFLSLRSLQNMGLLYGSSASRPAFDG